jgi:hypothetical protein
VYDNRGSLGRWCECEPIRRKLIALTVEEQDALCQRFERAKSEGDRPNDADASDLTRFCHHPLSGHDREGDERRKSRGFASPF